MLGEIILRIVFKQEGIKPDVTFSKIKLIVVQERKGAQKNGKRYSC